MARYVDMFFRVSVPIKTYTKLSPVGPVTVEGGKIVVGKISLDENFRGMIEHRFQGINKNITVTKDRPTQER